MNKYILILLLLTSCSENVIGADTVILLNDKGEFKRSEVKKFGPYCTAAWYSHIENLLIKRDGNISNFPFKYKWTLNEFNSEAGKIWFDKNCKEPLQ